MKDRSKNNQSKLSLKKRALKKIGGGAKSTDLRQLKVKGACEEGPSKCTTGANSFNCDR